MRARYLPFEFDDIELVVEGFLEDIIPVFDKNVDELTRALLDLLRGKVITDERLSPTSHAGRSAAQLLILWNNEQQFLEKTFGRADESENPITVAILRTIILEILIKYLHTQFPEYQETHPPLHNDKDSELNGMPRIRVLFQEYMNKTQPNTFERYLLALKILLEKEVLGLFSRIFSTDNILTQPDSAPGDFSHLDLHALTITREAPGNGQFYDLQLQNCQCDNTLWKNVCLEQTDFTGTTLTDAVFESVVDREGQPISQEQLILDPTQIEDSLVVQEPTFSPEQLRDIRAVRDQLNKEIMSCWPYPNKNRKRIKLAALDELILLGECVRKRGEETAEKLVQFIIEKYGIETTAGERSHRVADLFARLQESTPSQQARQSP